MKKIVTIILGLTLLAGCSPSRADMQKRIDDLNASVLTLTEDNEELMSEKEIDMRHIEYLCALYGESSSNGMIKYLGNGMFVHSISNEMQMLDDLEEMCINMVEAYEKDVFERSANLITEED